MPPRRVERTRNMGTWTEAQYWGAIRSTLRQRFRFWRPITSALKSARLGKGAYLCAKCGRVYPRDEVEVHHVNPCGSLKEYDDLPGWVKRLTEEDPSLYKVLCTQCHKELTHERK
jgi:DNA-directed RNA polymerase subunit RPC12/RpoP